MHCNSLTLKVIHFPIDINRCAFELEGTQLNRSGFLAASLFVKEDGSYAKEISERPAGTRPCAWFSIGLMSTRRCMRPVER
jgi:hypothetical protein